MRKSLPGGVWRAVLLGLTALAAIASASSATRADCDLRDAGVSMIVEVLNTESLLLEDGRALRLVGTLGPRTQSRWAEAMGLAQTLTRSLEQLVLGQPARLRFGERERDRYGRVLAHVFIERAGESVWVQESLVRQGLVMAHSFDDNRACVRQLQAAEQSARDTGAGFWGQGVFRVRDAADPDSMQALSYSFQIVEGRVAEVTDKRGRVYINFGADWRTDFTVAVAPSHRKAFDGSGIDLIGLAGQRVRVRGWLKSRNGPLIEATHPEQIELLEGRPAAEHGSAFDPASEPDLAALQD